MSGRRAGRPLLPGPTDGIRRISGIRMTRASHTVTLLGGCPEPSGMGLRRKGAASRCGGSVGW